MKSTDYHACGIISIKQFSNSIMLYNFEINLRWKTAYSEPLIKATVIEKKHN